MNLEDIWNNSLSKIGEQVGEGIVDLWFKPMKPSQIKEQQVTIEIPNRFFKDWIEDNYPDIIAKAMESILGYPLHVR
ncbi:MAG: chromosomal replication initiator protein DnaA, partial [Nitrospira sp.]|nr:chromosomal replication initiator protein DnaA [Nitrospira sp.]